MSSFVYKDFWLGFRLTRELDMSNSAELAVQIKNALGAGFEESIVRDDSESEGPAIIFDDPDGAIRVRIDKDVFSVLVMPLGDDKLDAQKIQALKSSAIALLRSGVFPDTYRSVFFRASAFFFPVTEGTKAQSFRAVWALARRLAGQTDEDITHVKLELRKQLSDGMSGVEYEVADDEALEYAALNVGVARMFMSKEGLPADSLIARVNNLEVMRQLEDESAKLSRLVK